MYMPKGGHVLRETARHIDNTYEIIDNLFLSIMN